MMLFNSSKTKSSAIRGIFCASLLCVVNIANAILVPERNLGELINNVDPAFIADLEATLLEEYMPYARAGGNFAPFLLLGVAATVGAAYLGHCAYTYYYSDDRAAVMGEDLEEALLFGELALVEEYLNDANLYSLSASKRTPLCLAAARGHTDVVRYLINDCGVDVNEWGLYRNGCLLEEKVLANPEIVALLLAAGANVHEKNSWGLTPLDIARMNHCDESVELLLAHGADELPWTIWAQETLGRLLLPSVDVY